MIAREAAPGGPLSRLKLRGVGPAPSLKLDLAMRLNLITGDATWRPGTRTRWTFPLDNPDTDRAQGRKVHRMLRRALSEIDPFWLRWRHLAEKPRVRTAA